ncbi:serine/threonine protein kinase, partial [bacterium]
MKPAPHPEPPPRLRQALRFETPAAFPPPLPVQEPEWHAGDPVPGTQYRYVRELGQGVQGLAIEVEHAFLGARAAMKILRAQHVSRRRVADRVRDEARALVELRHPNIVRVTDGGMTAEREPRPFFVMELLKGDTLRAHVKKAGGSLGVRETLDMAIDILDALDHAHARHMVHRDVKPANIFLARSNPGPRAILLDFGIASVVEPGGENRAGFSGTYEYAAPEQLDGYLTAQSDVYALATVMYVCLAGRHPFAGAAREELARMQRHVVAPSLESVREDVPGALADLIARAMEKDPARRPKSAFALAQKLRDVRTALRAPKPRSKPRLAEEPSRVGTTDQLLRDLRPGVANEPTTHEATTQARELETATSLADTCVRATDTTSVLVAPWLPPKPALRSPVRAARPGRPRPVVALAPAAPAAPLAAARIASASGSGPVTVTGPR